ncbi:tRNA (adenosine(37)-N6)-threonylcarbamoyltransferase complex dimerization subunit type 1 TsaB [Sphingomonas sp. FW199]|uniref:tRNA (adenosine(37)-N6)-threonylcarbamoyltransferase complex dimerization subunit type 1 TsaB n=1 Tax=Sphingomonas sp. FW199 TaxID=3400217 RepID=UPI003CE9871C
MKTLVIDTATAACSVALFDGDRLVGSGHETVGRGHAERLVPMIADLPGGGRADQVLVDCGPGSFTGVRVGLAAAIGLGIGWGVPVSGYSSMALIAASAPGDGPLSVAIIGGHGELFVQAFGRHPLAPADALRSLIPAAAIEAVAGRPVFGSAAEQLKALAPGIDAHDALPDAARAMLLPPALRALPARPIYGRAPDAKVKGAAATPAIPAGTDAA